MGQETKAPSPAANPGFYDAPTQPVGSPADYKPFDFSAEPAAVTQQARLDNLIAGLNTTGYAQAAQNVRGVGNKFGLMGSAGSGAAQAAAAQGFAVPIAQAKANAAGLALQGQNSLDDRWTGVIAPTYQQPMSQAEMALLQKKLNQS